MTIIRRMQLGDTTAIDTATECLINRLSSTIKIIASANQSANILRGYWWLITASPMTVYTITPSEIEWRVTHKSRIKQRPAWVLGLITGNCISAKTIGRIQKMSTSIMNADTQMKWIEQRSLEKTPQNLSFPCHAETSYYGTSPETTYQQSMIRNIHYSYYNYIISLSPSRTMLLQKIPQGRHYLPENSYKSHRLFKLYIPQFARRDPSTRHQTISEMSQRHRNKYSEPTGDNCAG